MTNPLAHRGLFDNIMGPPENSLGAFTAARDAGYGFECDVRLLADGEVVIFHDDEAMRLADVPGPIEERMSAELEGLRLLWTDEKVPLLSDVLRLINGSVPILIETKTAGDKGVLEFKLWETVSAYAGEWGVVSFNPHSVGWFADIAPGVPRGLNLKPIPDTAECRAGFAERLDAMLAVARPGFIGCEIYSLPEWAVPVIKDRGLPILAWTVRDEASLDKATRLCDNYVFEGIRP